MRLGLVILVLALIAAGRIHLSRSETALRHEVQLSRIHRRGLNDQLWDLEIETGYQITPMAVRARLERIDGDPRIEYDERIAAASDQ